MPIEPNFSNRRIEFSRRFLLTDLPEPLTRASAHRQFFDNHLTQTRLFLRQIRTPQTREWKRLFVQQAAVADGDFSRQFISEVELSQYEYEVLAVFEGNELRYNRYFDDFENKKIAIDLYLGGLWGLIIASVNFEDESEMQNFAPPEFVFAEITDNEMFQGAKLVDLKFADIQKIVSSL